MKHTAMAMKNETTINNNNNKEQVNDYTNNTEAHALC